MPPYPQYSNILQNIGVLWMYTAHMAKIKTSNQLERHFKGIANHWRIDILHIVAKRPGITLEEIADGLRGNFKTISEHTKKLSGAGLIDKTYKGRSVTHTLSPYGKIFVAFIKSF